MKFRFQLMVVALIVGLGVLVTTFTNCAGLNQGSDELSETVFSDYGDCTLGRMCVDEADFDCYPSEWFHQPEPGIVCQRFEPEALVKKANSRMPASVVKKEIRRKPAVYRQTMRE